MAKGTDIERLGAEYPVLAGEQSGELMLALRENFGEDGPGVNDFDRIQIPGGGGTAWEVPTLEGTDSARQIQGIVVAWKSPRAFWSKDADEGPAQPPDCASDEGDFGNGAFGPGSAENPSGRCEECPMNEWGSQEIIDMANGKGETGSRAKACKEMRQLFLIRPGTILPVVVTLPPTSIQPLRKYFLRLANEGTAYYGVVTELSLKQQQSGSMRWSTVELKMVRKLDAAELSAVKDYSDTIKASLSRPAPVAPREVQA